MSSSRSTSLSLTLKQKIHVTSDKEYVLKILNQQDSAKLDYVDLLTKINKFLYTNGFNLPFPIPSLQGSEIITLTKETLLNYKSLDEDGSIPAYNNPVAGHAQFSLRILIYIPGKILHYVPQTPRLMFKLGGYIGILHTELQVY